MGYGLAQEASGEIIVVGGTVSSDFPTTLGAYDTTHNGKMDAFALRLSADGSTLEYSTFLGGDEDDFALAVDLDPCGNGYRAKIACQLSQFYAATH